MAADGGHPHRGLEKRYGDYVAVTPLDLEVHAG